MYESYTRQALPERKYRELLGTALCVFNANNAFVIENILRVDQNNAYNWYSLIDQESGKLKPIVKTTIAAIDENVSELFSQLVAKRNRIIHSFQITDSSGQQMLATKEPVNKGNTQYVLTEEYLLDFIKENEALCLLLHKIRGF